MHTKSWPTDAVIIVAANRGEERREVMEAVEHVVCRHCGQELAADTATIRVVRESPHRMGRPVEFFCIPCFVLHDPRTITHFADHRVFEGQDASPTRPRPPIVENVPR